MELKNAVAVCLISLFSATLVVLVARALDSQAASRLEPQLASIVEELQAIRKQGGIAASPGTASNAETAADGLVVYYFHSNTRCPTCQSIESQAKDTVQTDFAAQLRQWRHDLENPQLRTASRQVPRQEVRDSDARGRPGKDESRPGRGLEASGRGLGVGGRQTGFRKICSRRDQEDASDGAPKRTTVTPDRGSRKNASSTPTSNLPLPPATPALPLPK